MAFIKDNQRLAEIDLIRGIALLGIFLMNIDFMSSDFILVENWSDNFSNSFDFIAGKIKFLFFITAFHWYIFTFIWCKHCHTATKFQNHR